LYPVKIEFVHCHRKPERSFFFRGRQFPVCSRCTGFYLGYLTLPVFTFSVLDLSMLWSILLVIPALADGLTQAYFNRESNNALRLITGLTAGIGVMSITSIIGKGIGHFIKNNFI
jgi:uncharacterized membrane protein